MAQIKKIVIMDEEGNTQELNVLDCTILALCEDDKVCTQISQNAAINLELTKSILKN